MKRFCLLLLGFAAFLMLACAAFNMVVDPYDVLRIVNIEGFNLHRTRAMSDGGRVNIGDNLLRGEYRTAFLGNSRVLRGMPSRPPWPGSVYNAGMNSGSAFEVARAAILAGRSPNTQCVLITLELEDFNSIAKVKGSYWVSALADGSRPLAITRQLLNARTFSNALRTIEDNAAGVVDPPSSDIPREAPQPPGAPRQHFEAMARDSFNYYRSFEYDPERMRLLMTVIERLSERGIQVLVLFSPIHAWREEGIFRAGREADYFRMRREAIAALAPLMERRARAPCVQGAGLQIWDFAGYQGPARTDPPAPSAAQNTPYYFEASHFKPVVGEAGLRRIAGASSGEGVFAADQFGVRVNPQATAAEEQALHARRAAWLATSSGREASARFAEWAREDAPAPDTTRFYISRDDWAALDRELPPLSD